MNTTMKDVLYKVGAFILCSFISLAAYSQEVRKNPVRQTSANKEETVYKPQAKATSSAGKQRQNDKKVASGKKQPTEQVKNKKKARAKKTTAKAAAKKVPTIKAASARYWTLKTNVPMLAVDVKNLALEVQVSDKISVDFPVMLNFSDQSNRRSVRMVGFQPEGRWWLQVPGKGHFFGVHAHVAWFNARWKENRYQDEGRPLSGAGLSYGYKMNFGTHWGAEFNLGAGYANMKYNTYYNIDNGAQLNTRIRHYWGITRLGLSLVYRL